MNWLGLLKRLWNNTPLSDKNRWRVTQLLLEPILPFIKDGTVATAYLRENAWQSKRIRPFQGDSFPKLPPQSKPDIFIWAVIDWRYRFQRPQHLAKGFAERGYRVFYISTSFVNSKFPGFELEGVDEEGRLHSVRLHLAGRPRVSMALVNRDDTHLLTKSIASLLAWTNSKTAVSIIQHPFWFPLVHALPNSHMVYDCLDHHQGFGNTGQDIASLEHNLLREAEYVVATSQFLHDMAATFNQHVSLIRNAAEFDFFSAVPISKYKDPQGRKIIGYYGAISDWMDIILLEKIACHFNNTLLLLVGADDTGAARRRLAHFANVLFTGEVLYEELPFYLYSMDVCILPFRVTPLTLATNPVKIYEYLSAGKPVVSIKLPELEQFNNLVSTADSHQTFIQKIEESLAIKNDKDEALRKKFASQHTWSHRTDEFEIIINQLTLATSN